jgi:hypothetical protein
VGLLDEISHRDEWAKRIAKIEKIKQAYVLRGLNPVSIIVPSAWGPHFALGADHAEADIRAGMTEVMGLRVLFTPMESDEEIHCGVRL